jgi:hypothetical protein
MQPHESPLRKPVLGLSLRTQNSEDWLQKCRKDRRCGLERGRGLLRRPPAAIIAGGLLRFSKLDVARLVAGLIENVINDGVQVHCIRHRLISGVIRV